MRGRPPLVLLTFEMTPWPGCIGTRKVRWTDTTRNRLGRRLTAATRTERRRGDRAFSDSEFPNKTRRYPQELIRGAMRLQTMPTQMS